MTYWISALLCLACATLITADQTVQVTSISCGEMYNLDALGDVTLEYTGADLGSEPACTLTFVTDDRHNDLCTSSMAFDNQCKVQVEYHGGYLQSYSPDEVFCHTQPDPRWCTEFTRMYISFVKKRPTSIDGQVNIRLQVQKESTKVPDYNPALISVSMLIGVIIAAIVITIVLVVVTFVLYYRRQQAKRPKKYTTSRPPVAAGTMPDHGAAIPNEGETKEETQHPDPDDWLELDMEETAKTGADNPAYEETGNELQGSTA